jgi:hypothetical protein
MQRIVTGVQSFVDTAEHSSLTSVLNIVFVAIFRRRITRFLRPTCLRKRPFLSTVTGIEGFTFALILSRLTIAGDHIVIPNAPAKCGTAGFRDAAGL